MHSLEEQRQILKKKWNLKKMNNRFPVYYKMKTRAEEKYKARDANTERFKNSSIITMQKMMNHDTRKQLNSNTYMVSSYSNSK